MKNLSASCSAQKARRQNKDRLCPYCNAQMILLGYKQVRTELRITPAKVERVRYMQEELICPECRVW